MYHNVNMTLRNKLGIWTKIYWLSSKKKPFACVVQQYLFIICQRSNRFYDPSEAWKIMDAYGTVSLFDKISDRDISQLFETKRRVFVFDTSLSITMPS